MTNNTKVSFICNTKLILAFLIFFCKTFKTIFYFGKATQPRAIQDGKPRVKTLYIFAVLNSMNTISVVIVTVIIEGYAMFRKQYRKIFLMITLFVFAMVTVTYPFDSLADSLNNTGPDLLKYKKLAKQSELIVIGIVDSIQTKREIFGWSGNKPYYANFQYIYVTIDEIVKGVPKTNPIIIQATQSFSHDPKFTVGEKVIVMVNWWKDKNHGEYYALSGSGVLGKFSIISDPSSSRLKVTNEILIGKSWKINSTDLIEDIRRAQ